MGQILRSGHTALNPFNPQCEKPSSKEDNARPARQGLPNSLSSFELPSTSSPSLQTIRVDPPASRACSLLSQPPFSVLSLSSTQELSSKTSFLCSIAPRPPPLPNLLPPPPLPSQPPTNPTHPNLDLRPQSSTHLPLSDFTLGRTLDLDRKRGSGSKRLEVRQAGPRRRAGVSGKRWFITPREQTGDSGLTVTSRGGNLW